MSTIRVAKRERFTVISNDTVQDQALTWGARGLLTFLLSKPDGWTVNREYLISQSPDGQTIVRRYLAELTAAGYLHVRRFQGDDGRVRTESVIYERPDWLDIHQSESRPVGDQPVVVSTEVVSTEVVKEHAQPSAALVLVGADPFDEFWRRYPKKVGKGAARKAWAKAARKASVDEILAAVPVYARSRRVLEGYPKDPATWLNAECWLDEPEPAVRTRPKGFDTIEATFAALRGEG